jgi:hypothetical protein
MSEFEDEALTSEEQGYFQSGGEKTEGLSGGGEPSKTEPAGEAGAQTETKGEEGKEGVDATKEAGSKFVPHQAFHEERERRKAVEVEVRELRERYGRTDERLKLLNELLEPEGKKAGQQEEQIDPEKDIFGAFKQAVAKISALESKLSETGTKFEQQTADQQLISSYQNDARQFQQKEPAFFDSYKHLLSVRDGELKQLGVDDAKERAAIISDEEKKLVATAARRGQSPAQTIFELAKLRGFTPKAKEEPAKSEAEKQLETIQKGVTASQSLSRAGGSPSEGLTAAKLADMSEDEFGEYFSKLSKAEQRRLMGS